MADDGTAGDTVVGTAQPVGSTTGSAPHPQPRLRALSCRLDGHDPGQPALTEAITEFGDPALARAVVHCNRCGSYLSSFDGPLRSVRQAAHASRMHGLRFLPV